MTRALVVHATDLLVRGFASTAADRASDGGEPTGGLYVVARSIRRAFAFKEPDVAIAVIDRASDPAWPAPLTTQAARLEELCRAHGLACVFSAEPGNMVAAYTRASLENGHDVVIVGGDKRLAQLVDDNAGAKVWWYDAFKDVRYTPLLVKKRFEVPPSIVSEWLALVGDGGALPGVKGIGKKGATTLIEAHGSVTAALGVLDELEGRTGKALRAGADTARSWLAVAKLDAAAITELPAPLSACKLAPSRAQELYGELGFFELLSSEEQQAIDVSICRDEGELAATVARFDAGPIAIQVVTDDPSPATGELVGLALGQRDFAIYVPFLGKGAVAETGPTLLAPLLADATRRFVGHDTKHALLALARCAVPIHRIEFDTTCASHLGEPSKRAPHDLELLSRHLLRQALPSDSRVRGVGKRRKAWSTIAIEKTAEHAGRLAVTAYALHDVLKPQTDPALLDEYLVLSQLLTKMELKGIACDKLDLDRAGADFMAIAAMLETEIFEIAGKKFNLGSTKQLGSVLFEDLGLPIVKRTKTGWSTANEALERIEHAHPIVSLVMRWRRLRRLMDSWVTALGASVSADGRVHSMFHPARSFSGRLVNSNPDLGRVPGRTPEMSRIRHAFAAPPNTQLLSLDYRQLGLYVLAHLTKDPALAEPLARGDDIHIVTASAVLEVEPGEVTTEQRQLGKVINFATFAGQGAGALSQQLGVDSAEARGFIERFDARYSLVRAFQDEQLRLAQERGYIVTIAGRHWPIGGLSSNDPMQRAYAERLARRATHEGSVADVSRRGLLRAGQALNAAGLRAMPLLQIHDEVLFEVPDDELERAATVAQAAMEAAFELEVPLEVGRKAGPNWADLEPF